MTSPRPDRAVIVGMTGASGAVLGRATVDELLSMDVPVVLTATSAARMVWLQEMEESFGVAIERWSDGGDFTFHAASDLSAPIASGSYPTLGMAVMPCSMATAGAIAHGIADNLVRRAADVCLKEKRPLVIVPRETPLHAVHLSNLASLAGIGATILPPEPPFYLKPQTVDDVVRFMTQRTLLALGLIDELPREMQYSAAKGQAGSHGAERETRR